jgi:Zn-dependent protease with chaperone function
VDDRARLEEELAQQRMAMRSEFEMTARLWRVGYPVLKGAAFDCQDTLRPSLGMLAIGRAQVPSTGRVSLADVLGLGEARRVLAVYRGGAADAAGVREGDVIAASSAGFGPQNEPRTEAMRRMPPGTPVRLDLLRQGATVTVEVLPDLVCDYPLNYRANSQVNAFADGGAIYLTRGMLRFAADDRELALVIAHELAHNTMGHRGKKTVNATVGLIFDLLGAAAGVNTGGVFSDIGAQAFSQDFEREADHVGMYYLARAGYPTEGVADFWRRMATEHPSSIRTNHSATHPPTTERFLALESIGAQIRAKAARGEPLEPDRSKR